MSEKVYATIWPFLEIHSLNFCNGPRNFKIWNWNVIDVISSIFTTLGPAMPIKIHGLSMVSFNGDLYTIGGYSSYGNHYQTSIFKLCCFNEDCDWTRTNQELKVARADTVAIPVENSLVNCVIA